MTDEGRSPQDLCRTILTGPPARRNGFTLLEVLIAVGLAALIATALYSSFSLAHSAVETVDTRLLRVQEARFLLDIMRREIESGFCSREKPYSSFKVEDRDYYGKQASRLSLTTFSSPMAEVVRVEYLIEERNGRLSLRKRIERPSARQGGSRDETLIEDMDAFTLEVLHQGKWIKTWDCSLTGGLPEQVKISLTFSAQSLSGDRRKATITFSDHAFPRVGSRL